MADEDDSSSDGGQGVNLDLLYSDLSPEALAALQVHLKERSGDGDDNNSEEQEDEEVNEIRYDDYTRTVAFDGSTIDVNRGPEVLHLALIKNHHSLWGELLWNAAKTLAAAIDRQVIQCEDMHCLELGAGAALPSMVAALNGASTVVITDYGTAVDRSLIEPIDLNIQYVTPHVHSCTMKSDCHIFGYDVAPLLDLIPGEAGKFDYVFLADLVFNRSEHRKLLKTVSDALRCGGTAWVTFSHHDPEKADADMVFFALAQEEFNFSVELVCEETWPPMFVENDGLDEMRGRVFFYKLIKL